MIHDPLRLARPALTLIFNLVLAISVVMAYVVETGAAPMHTLAGYLLLGGSLLRLWWEFGGAHGSAASDAARAAAGPALRFRRLKLAALSLMLATAISGFAANGAQDAIGPLSGLLWSASALTANVATTVHLALSGLTLGTMVAALVAWGVVARQEKGSVSGLPAGR